VRASETAWTEGGLRLVLDGIKRIANNEIAKARDNGSGIGSMGLQHAQQAARHDVGPDRTKVDVGQ
jgi:hypothetical protein